MVTNGYIPQSLFTVFIFVYRKGDIEADCGWGGTLRQTVGGGGDIEADCQERGHTLPLSSRREKPARSSHLLSQNGSK